MKSQVKYLQNLFYDLLNDYGQVYIVIKHSPDSSIGNRGFTEEEKKKGLVLIFNRKNYKNLEWTEDGSIVTALGFGVNNKPEKCYLHSNDIMSIFSPDAKVRLDRWDMWDEAEKPVESGMIGGAAEAEKPLDEKIVSLDSFKKTKK